ncbi:PEPxxWA-CTERM sorting domain-containing protein [Qipengyuania atrilutea]|uniref:PEPxxWA-CTERM sorting domain-containing protein n=1 Tax=Qipengyuania atrilutea TaxID=2744473 RepID=A0A850GYI3_9SPHN|nr:PEPxxWA-CTERM sorting domain-containing protein [Actirhodobacter atriluteus]NVD44694.1 PEPxxWA-CTERM sorting domain-containing protein [Actirhodobacter atriluteus]
MILPTLSLRSAAALGTAAAIFAAAPASAATFVVDFETLNDSGVTGSAFLETSDDNETLTVTINASGLEVGQPHVAHIHGRFNNGGQAMNSFTPTLDDDTDGDGFIELGEGLPRYGQIILPLTGFSADAMGNANYSMTFDLTDSSIFNADFTAEDLLPLQLREIVLHGLTVPAVGDGTPGEVDGTAGYKAVLPVAAGEIRPGNMTAAVPEPATWAMMLLGFFGLGGVMRTKTNVRRTLSYRW